MDYTQNIITGIIVVVVVIMAYKIYQNYRPTPPPPPPKNERFGFGGLLGDLITGGEDLVHLGIEHRAQIEAAAKEAAKLAEELYKKRQAERLANAKKISGIVSTQMNNNLRPGMCNCPSCANGTHPPGCDCSRCGGLYSAHNH